MRLDKAPRLWAPRTALRRVTLSNFGAAFMIDPDVTLLGLEAKMNVVPIPVGSMGFDTDTQLTADTAAKLAAAGASFVVRYLGSITSTELVAIQAAGLGVSLVTFARPPGWMPSAAMGAEDGANDVARLHTLGVPPGMVIWIDLEGSGGSAPDTEAWVNARSAALVAAGYLAGLYVGDGCVLGGAELYSLPHITRYWRGFNAGIPTPECGFCQMQLFPPDQVVDGVQVDIDFVQKDYNGRLPTMLKP